MDDEPGKGGFSRPARLVDLAERSGLSIKTISRVLNHEPYVSEKTQARVWAVVDELGYVADNRARSLRATGGRSGYIGLLVPDIRNGFFASLVNTVEKRIGSAGQTLLLGITDESPAKEAKYLDVFRQNRVDALIAVPAGSDALVKFTEQVPTVILDRMKPGLEGRADYVTANNYDAAFSLTSHLIEAHGFKRVMMVAGENDISSVNDRRNGYSDAVSQAGLEPVISAGHLTLSDAEDGAAHLLRASGSPTAVFATGSRMYWGTMAALARTSRMLPRDVAVATFDGSNSIGGIGPVPTQARLPVEAMVARAFQLVTERMHSPQREPRTVIVDCDVEYGMTCGCLDLAASGPLVVRTGR